MMIKMKKVEVDETAFIHYWIACRYFLPDDPEEATRRRKKNEQLLYIHAYISN